MRKNVDYVMNRRKGVLILEKSFHVVSVDSEKEGVAAELLEFVARLGVAPEPARARG